MIKQYQTAYVNSRKSKITPEQFQKLLASKVEEIRKRKEQEAAMDAAWARAHEED